MNDAFILFLILGGLLTFMCVADYLFEDLFERQIEKHFGSEDEM